MKKILNYSLLVTLFAFVVTIAKASDEDFNISVGKSEVVNVEVVHVAKNLSISVSDANGIMLYEYSNMQSGPKTLDFSKVPDGYYFIKMENEKSIQTTLVEKENNTIHVNKNYGFLVKPVFEKKGKSRLNLYFVNVTKSNVQVDVYDNSHTLIDSFTSSEPVIEKGLDFSKIPAVSYNLVLSVANSDYTFSKSFDNE
ncbi:MAG TPA: T9SS type A sorting domain-containing protein [Arachidicoccus sp.]